MQHTGILGGTFDPPHIGHLIMAEEARINRGFDEIWWLPNALPPHKEASGATSQEDRLEMVKMITDLSAYYKLCDVEMERDGRSFTIDTIEELTRRYPDHRFEFIMGGDSLTGFYKWHEAKKLSSLLPFTVFARPGYPIPDTLVPESLTILKDISLDLSSTDIRDRMKKGKNNRYLLTDQVYSYIRKKGLYERSTGF